MKRILVLVLAFCMLVPMATFAETTEVSYAGANTTYNVYIEGVATSSSVSIMLKGQNNNIAYINELKLNDEDNGKYALKFKFTGDISNYGVYVRDIDTGADISESVKTAVATKALYSASLAVAVDGEDREYIKADDALKVSVDIKNKYGDDDSMVVLVAAYGANNKLLATKITSVDVLYEDLSATKNVNLSGFTIPKGTLKAKVFAWSDIETMIPVADAKSIESQELAGNKITALVMHPGSDETERRFTWYNSSVTTGARIQYASKAEYEAAGGFTDNNLNIVEGTTEVPYNNKTSISCKANITDLEPNTEYYYRVGHKYRFDDTVYSFKTYDPANADKQTFIMVSDLHVNSYDVDSAADSTYINHYTRKFDSIMLHYPDAEFIASTGDNVSQANMSRYTDDDELYRTKAELEMEILFAPKVYKSVSWASTLGNHEARNVGNAVGSVTKWHYNLPNDDGETGTYYSSELNAPNTHGNFWFRNGDVLVVGINAVQHTTDVFKNSTSARNKEYIEKAIKANEDAKWRVLINHVPAYSLVGSFSEMPLLRQRFAEIDIDDYDFDVVFTGHQHSYSRSKQLLTDDETEYKEFTNTSGTTTKFITPKVVSEDKISKTTDSNGSRIDTVTDPEGTVHINIPSLQWSPQGTNIHPDYADFIERMATTNTTLHLSHNTDITVDTTADTEKNRWFTYSGPSYVAVTVEKTPTGQQMKFELVNFTYSPSAATSNYTVKDTYIIKKTIAE